jgi:hypothetical protein
MIIHVNIVILYPHSFKTPCRLSQKQQKRVGYYYFKNGKVNFIRVHMLCYYVRVHANVPTNFCKS